MIVLVCGLYAQLYCWSVLDRHESVVQALSEYAEVNSEETASKARGLLKHITGGEFVLGTMMSLLVINMLESLNKAVQSRSFAIPVLW